MGQPRQSGKASGAVNERRLWERHEAIGRIGGTPNGGVNRQALTPEDAEARQLFAGWGAELGLEVLTDGIGNLFLRRRGRDGNAAPVISGSHLDTQPSGGRFDGIFGVLAALEAVHAIEEARVETRRSLEIAVWTNEEGTRFIPGCMGSKVFVNPSEFESMLAVTDLEGISVAKALAATQAIMPVARRISLGHQASAYVEAHIEQGPELEASGKTIGIVTAIQGRRPFRVEVRGEDAHAGTTPRRRRKDALSAAVAMIAELERLMENVEDRVRFTVGRLIVAPNAPSVVPGYAMFAIDFRHPDDVMLSKLGDRIEGICEQHRRGCSVTVTPLHRTRPVTFAGVVPDTIQRVTERLGLPYAHMLSGAGHDAENLAKICPTGMIFVPCERGISHNEHENAKPSDLAAGARVLTDVLIELADT
jgi:N-carbamoyl-L-amino-acid hydrolase